MHEREAKLSVEDDFEMPNLEGTIAGAGAELGPPVERCVEDTYYDTEDLRLLRWGCTMRHRKREGWTVKLAVTRRGPDRLQHAGRSKNGVLVRDEIILRGRAGRPPAEAVALVGAFTRGAPLVAIANIVTDRTARPWLAESGEVVVELVDDRVNCESADGRSSAFRQLEAEVSPGFDAHILDDLVERLKTAGATPEPNGIKVIKALGRETIGRPEVEIARLDRYPTARQVIQQAIARSVLRLIRELPAAQLGEDAEGVHQARVASRRLRSDLKTFRPLLDTEWADGLRRDLRPLTDHLGPVRDADVLLERFATLLVDHPEIDRDGADGALELLGTQRDEARSVLVEYLSSAEFHDLLDRLVAGAIAAPIAGPAGDPATEQLPQLVRARWRKLDKAVDRLAASPLPDALHRVRILAKHTRYAAEAVADTCGPAAGRFAKNLHRVQDELGDQHDIIVAEEWLVTNGGQLDPAAAFAAGRLAQLLHATTDVHAKSWRKPYQKARRTRNRNWFT